ncbi:MULTISPECIES: hypothetical protein [Enterococcus]|uniref:Uncharacterized protein n=1 Tax=Enterococcus sulfureus ATCC 49903 TaxID=1140003 RepID=S0KZQ4_9ENTE|nr:hypothetical protein [Enterococcus sulfureus]EOT46535.1 hypothetical protein OMY_01684 [Enterococcus sulfureus ATCC 49903]EOT86153.1 hypothetical protein I573_00906 [Enterococcus sulfureus ATCC 49903]
MNSFSNRQKFLLILCFTCLIAIGSYIFKDKINQSHYKNEHYLATNIRKKETDSFSYRLVNVTSPLSRSELITYGQQLYQQEHSPVLLQLQHTNFFDPTIALPNSIYYTIDPLGSHLFIGYIYQQTTKQHSPSIDFSLQSSRQVYYLEKSQMLYTIVLDRPYTVEEWFPFLASYVQEVRQAYHDKTIQSLVYIKINQQAYLYLSDQPTQLFTVERII